MKTYLRAAAVLSVLCLATVGFAADKPADKKDAPKHEKCADAKDCKNCKEKDCKCEECAKNAKPKMVVLTGSYLPQRLTMTGRITDGASPVIVLTREDIENSGAMNLADALRKAVPSIR